MLFAEIPGHNDIKERLIRSVKEQRISHAQLFLGAEGSGSLAIAVAYAQYMMCEQKGDNDACGVCASCRKVQKLVHPDLHFSYPYVSKQKDDISTNYVKEWRLAFLENPYMGLETWMGYLDTDNKQPNIYISECHDIIRRLSYKSFESEFKLMIIWLPEYLGSEGNTLLKLIEEPPEKTVFILVAEKYDQILNTILSRTQLIKISPFSDLEINQYLVEKGCSPEAAKRFSYLANGNMHDALALMNEEDTDLEALFVAWFRLCYSRKGLDLLPWIEKVVPASFGRENQKNMLRFGLQVLRDCLLFNAQAESILRFESQHFELPKLASIINSVNAPLLIGHLEQAIYHIERNANPKILFLDLSIQMMRDLQRKP